LALKEAGVRLIAQNFQEYMRQMGQINKAHKTAFSQTDNIRKQNSEVAKSSKEAGGLSSVMGALNLKTLGAAGAIAIITKGVISLTKSMIQLAKESALIAARNETLGVVLEQVGDNAGYTAQQISFAEASVKKMGITTSAARQSLVKMAQANIEWAQASELARIAQDAAVIANTDSSQAFETMVFAIQSGSVRMLRTLGINVSFQQAYDKMAKTLGTTSEALTEQQKVQARVNAVVERGSDIAGAYEAAMGTVGKQMSSLTRLEEEAKAQLGEFTKFALAARVELQTGLLKAANAAGQGFSGLGMLINHAWQESVKMRQKVGELAESWLQAQGWLKEGQTILDGLAERMFTFSKGVFIVVAGLQASVQTFLDFRQVINDVVAALIKSSPGFQKFVGGLIAIRDVAQSTIRTLSGLVGGQRAQLIDEESAREQEKTITGLGKTFEENFKERMEDLVNTFPFLNQSWDEFKTTAEVSLDRGTEAIQRQIAALKQQQAQLEASAEALRKVEDIQLRFQRAVADENRRYAKEQADFARETAKKREDLQRKLSKDLQNLERDAAKREAEIIADASRKRVEDEKKRNLELEQERRRFELAQMQSLRRFQLDERRLAAEGDILGLIRLREDFALQQQEERENRDLELREQAEQERQRQQQEQQDIQRRLEDLRREVEERRQEIFSQHAEELAEFQRSNEEKRAEMQRSHQERLEDAQRARNESLQDLGRALQEEQKLTQEGMQAVAAEIAKVFGDQGAADALIQGWSDRSQSVMAQTLTAYQERLLELARAIEALESGETIPSPTAGAIPSRRPRRPDRVFRMQHGGSGVVTGPATFEVEPGITEAFSFRPVRARNTLDVNFNTLNVAGLEGASPGVVDAAVEKMWQTMQEAVDRLSLRKGRG